MIGEQFQNFMEFYNAMELYVFHSGKILLRLEVIQRKFTLRTALYVDARTWTYGDVRRRTSTCVNVRRCTVPYVDAGHYRKMLLSVVFNDAVCVCVNAAVEINVLDYNFAIRRRTSSYVNVRRRTRCERGFSLRLRIVCQKKR